jgi:hypothetical protein
VKLSSLPRKVKRGLPYFGKEIRAIISGRSPFFIAVPRVVHLWRTAPCNARCIMCDRRFPKNAAQEEPSRSLFPDDQINRALDEIHELCGRGTLISYTGWPMHGPADGCIQTSEFP